mmetsp:Transcript_151036/g.281692  ORF Transcript_151036/g.281692 Transcript_151036/m.281692 type:complete len:226 (+) Transcript_151036:131-808(+)
MWPSTVDLPESAVTVAGGVAAGSPTAAEPSDSAAGVAGAAAGGAGGASLPAVVCVLVALTDSAAALLPALAAAAPLPALLLGSASSQILTIQPFSPSASMPSEQMGHVHAGSSSATLSTSTSLWSDASHHATRVSSRPECASPASSRPISIMVTTARFAALLAKSAMSELTCDRGVRIASNAWPGCNEFRRAWHPSQRSKSRQRRQRYLTPAKSRVLHPSQMTPM